MDARLLEASAGGDSVTVRKILKKPMLVDINNRDDFLRSALVHACKGRLIPGG